ncbi:MAG: 2,3-bisphosphoglycerate-independent phosphoglycerate mutase [Chloroflexota bacterium]
MDVFKELSLKTESKIVLLVLDGLGGLPHTETGKTELEMARTPNLDRLSAGGICGLVDPLSPGITVGSGVGHLALFGYDPLTYDIGRGVLEAVGIDFDLKPGDVAARGTFCTVDKSGIVADRRAGRISTEKNAELCRLLAGMVIDGVEVLVSPVREHRFAVVFRGEGLSPDLNDTDPSREGLAPNPVKALTPSAEKLTRVVSEFISRAQNELKSQHPANMILLRGFSELPQIPSMNEIYKLTPAAVASYPMYRGLAKLVGMTTLKTGTSIQEEFETLRQNWGSYDFFFVHIKGTDSAGEDGDFTRKVRVIEDFDRALPVVTSLEPAVIVVTGDHSTPAMLKAHSWHPVPVLLYSRWCRADGKPHLSETNCLSGGMGRLPMTQLMPMMMANALKLTTFGA